MRDSACAGAVKSSWVMPGNSRKTIWVGVASVIGMVLAVAVDHPGARLAWRDRQPRFPMGLHLAAPVARCPQPHARAAAGQGVTDVSPVREPPVAGCWRTLRALR